MVVVNCLSKWAHIIPMTSDVIVSGVAQLFRDHIWKLHGLPEEVISDQGTQFVSSFTGQHPWLSVEPLRESHLETLKDFTSRMNKATDKAH